VLALAGLLAACSIDDSGPVRSVWRPEDAKPTYLDVAYLTDREPDANAPGGFGKSWGDKASCGTAEAVIPPAAVPGEKPQYGYIAKTWPRACATDKGSVGGVMDAIEAQAKARHCNSVFLFIHGFHTGFDGAVLRAAQVSHDALTGCATIAFSWSSEVKLERYLPDLEHSEYSLPFLSELLRELAASNLRVTILAHSTGDRLILAELSAFAHSRFPVRNGFIDELVLAAADVGNEKGNDDFAHLLADAAPYVRRTTIYASKMDGILLVSKYEHGGVGRAGHDPEADLAYRADDKTHIVDVIDASEARADKLDHSYFAMSPDAIADMGLALGGVPTADRMRSADGGKPTLICEDVKDCAGDPHYALAVASDRQPRLISRILLDLIPLIQLVP